VRWSFPPYTAQTKDIIIVIHQAKTNETETMCSGPLVTFAASRGYCICSEMRVAGLWPPRAFIWDSYLTSYQNLSPPKTCPLTPCALLLAWAIAITPLPFILPHEFGALLHESIAHFVHIRVARLEPNGVPYYKLYHTIYLIYKTCTFNNLPTRFLALFRFTVDYHMSQRGEVS
jgi:hypothetical protein